MPATRTLAYSPPPANRFDAESLVLDRGTAILIAKYLDGREAELFAVPLDPPPAGTAPAPAPVRPIGKLPGFTEPATGADLSADGTRLAVCSYRVSRIYHRKGQSDAWEKLAEVRYAQLPIEGIAWDGGDLILAAEEARGLYRLHERAWRANHDGTRTKADR